VIGGAGLLVAALLAGCSSGMDVSPGALVSGGRDLQKEQETAQRLAAVQVCPNIQVRQGTQVIRKYAPGKEGDPAGVLYQGTLTRFARECTPTPEGGTAISVGIAGRLIAGAEGTAKGSLTATLPIRVVLVQSGTEVLYSELHNVEATVSETQASVGWTKVVDGLVVPFQTETKGVVIYVGFDEGAPPKS
jgi:hypothetical protein